MKKPFVSIIIVNYNYANLLPRALDAINEQTFRDFEIVIVNNGSTDNSQEVIDNYILSHPGLAIKTASVKVNVGLYLGRNTGLDAAQGDYILINDADDWMEPCCLQVLAEEARSCDADKVCGAFKEIDVNGKQLRVVDFTNNYSKWLTVSSQATLYRRSIIADNNIRFHQSWLDDIDFNTQFNYYVKKHVVVNKPVFNYFVNQMSTSGAKVKKRSWTYLDLQHDMLDLFVPLIDKLDGSDKDELYYLMIKQYYFYLFHSNRYSSYREFLDNYRKSHEMMLEYLPGYMIDGAEKRLEKEKDRKSGIIITKAFLRAEKMHCIKLVIGVFLLASKISYLNP